MLGRKEVFMGKAKFGIFGDGKEVPQLAMAKVFRNGDFRAGYYRDQTFMLAIGELTLQQYFAQLYAHADVTAEPASAGRLMNGHFATRMLDEAGQLKDLTKQKNSSSDISPTAGQMPRLLGMAYASKLFRNNPDLKKYTNLSANGNEIAFGTIGNASTSEGMFYEAMNAAGVLQVPMIMCVWDDAYGISVPQEYHTTKGSISKTLAGLQRTATEKGFEIITVKGWDYSALLEAFHRAEKVCREEHVPVLVHVEEVTQPQGHSTSGSHERYKSKERLAWEAEYDCLRKMREWIIDEVNVLPDELDTIEVEARKVAKDAKEKAWRAFNDSMQADHQQAVSLLKELSSRVSNAEIQALTEALENTNNPIRLDAVKAVKKALRITRSESRDLRGSLIDWVLRVEDENQQRYSSHLLSESESSTRHVKEVRPSYAPEAVEVDGREIMQAFFDKVLERDPRVFAIGEDVGKIGDVNQGFAGLQQKYGEYRVTDTGIRECTIIGQGIGAALRGLRPITEIQYLDYLLYAVQIMSDDLACLQYRTRGGQKAPLIVRTRGHRLEGVWHSGSPMGMILHSLRGMHVLTPRDMTQAAGMYNTLLQADEPALVIECLNGYRLKERMPDNLGDYTVPLGIPETLREGADVTVVTYGSMCRVVLDAARELEQLGISCEVIDAQTLLPFDVHHSIVESVRKTNRLVLADEDVPGGASAYMMQKVLEEQGAYRFLDSAPVTIAAKEHRPAYSSDGDYFSKPSVETVVDKIYEMMREAEPARFPNLY